MAKILDLTVYKEETLDITLLDGRLVQTRKPTEKMFIELIAYQNIKSTDLNEVLNALNALVLMVLNNNINGVVITRAEVEAMPLNIKMVIVQTFTEFVNDIASQKN